MKCPECDIEMRWLYYPKSEYSNAFYEDHFVQTDYWYCRECDSVYRQWIESKVHRDKVEPIIVGSRVMSALSYVASLVKEKLLKQDNERLQQCRGCKYWHEGYVDEDGRIWVPFCDLFHGNGLEYPCGVKEPILVGGKQSK